MTFTAGRQARGARQASKGFGQASKGCRARGGRAGKGRQARAGKQRGPRKQGKTVK